MSFTKNTPQESNPLENESHTEAVVRRCSIKKVFYKKGVLKSITKLTGKHLCQSLFFNKKTLIKLC